MRGEGKRGRSKNYIYIYIRRKFLLIYKKHHNNFIYQFGSDRNERIPLFLLLKLRYYFIILSRRRRGRGKGEFVIDIKKSIKMNVEKIFNEPRNRGRGYYRISIFEINSGRLSGSTRENSISLSLRRFFPPSPPLLSRTYGSSIRPSQLAHRHYYTMSLEIRR